MSSIQQTQFLIAFKNNQLCTLAVVAFMKFEESLLCLYLQRWLYQYFIMHKVHKTGADKKYYKVLSSFGFVLNLNV